ncbi:MAG: type II toxin-antitoxin system tRNA(fMet)-specific endonuclease VapC [Nitrospiria bacterium]
MAISYMLDTNICIYLMNRNPSYEKVVKKIISFNSGVICLSAIVVAELRYGVEQSRNRRQNETALEEFLLPFEVVPFDQEAAIHYGKIRSQLKVKGNAIGPMDMLIAAHAISLGVILVSHNTKEFLRVPDLRLTDWSV